MKQKIQITLCCAESLSPVCNPTGSSPPASSVHGDSPGKNTKVGCHTLLQGSSQPRDRTQVSCISGRFFTIWAETPKNPGVGSLSRLQGIFPTQELNRGLLHCRRILYQLSHQESPQITLYIFKTFPQEKLWFQRTLMENYIKYNI